MKRKLIILLLPLSLFLSSKEESSYEVGTQFVLTRGYSEVLYHYIHDAIEISRYDDFLDPFQRMTVDARDLYRIKKGEKILLVESIREGKFYKVKLLTNKPKRKHYFIEKDNLRSYSLYEQNPHPDRTPIQVN
tara:strand:+ start:493 stop:891 length:399 start_codon:yes stop_codon:yes gene_type:complete